MSDMPINLDYAPGATPLDADELASLIPGHITTQGELNEWEQLKDIYTEEIKAQASADVDAQKAEDLKKSL